MLTLTTCLAYPTLPQNLKALVSWLTEHQIKTEVQPWQKIQEPTILLPLCAWDYASQPEQFRQWILHHQQEGSHFLNAPELLLWNMNKSYLLDLSNHGIHVIPSRQIEADSQSLQQAMQEIGWQDVVLKPIVGQSGKNVIRYQQGEPFPNFSLYPEGILLQPYIAEVALHGEISLIFFQGKFSHAVRRQPQVGDFRANSAYGVKIIPIHPDTNTIQQASQALKTLNSLPLYARVDGTLIGHQFLLNELELIEPALYLDTHPEAMVRLGQAIKSLDQCASFRYNPEDI